MHKLSNFIVKYRNLILVIAIALLIPSGIGYLNTKVNYDLLSYLPQDCESMKGQNILGEDFNLASVDFLVVQGMKDKDCVELKHKIEKIDGVEKVLWRDEVLDISIPKEALPTNIKKVLYSNNDSTMMMVTFKEETKSTRTMNAIKEIKKVMNKKCFLGGMSAISEDLKELTEKETPVFGVIAIVLCLVILFLGLESNFAPFIFLVGIAFPIAYNFGTNVFLGEISYITKSLALVLQLAVTLDYSIFLLHRYQEEKKSRETKEEAMSYAIEATFTSITSSSVTTIAGFLVLCVMRLTLGKDIGIVMAKGVIFGVICTIVVLPSLLMLFDKQIERHKHPILIKEFTHVPSFVAKHYKAIIVASIVAFVPMFYAQNHTAKYYDLVANMPEDFQSIIGTNLLKTDFEMTTTHFILVDENISQKDMGTMIDDVEKLDGINNVVAYDKFVGPRISPSFEPSAVKEILHKNGRKLIIANSDFRGATDEENNQIDQINDIVHAYDENALATGEGPLDKDLITTTDVDFQMVNILSIVAIFIIIAITFKSLALPVILVLSIELAISINMGIPFFTRSVLPFIAGIVIGTIQLGATVDYAILMTTRYREELENGHTPIESCKTAIQMSSPSIVTSALCFFSACIGVSFVSKMDLVASLCTLLARGAVISAVCIIVVLPSLLVAGETIIEKTTRKWPKAVKEK